MFPHKNIVKKRENQISKNKRKNCLVFARWLYLYKSQYRPCIASCVLLHIHAHFSPLSLSFCFPLSPCIAMLYESWNERARLIIMNANRQTNGFLPPSLSLTPDPPPLSLIPPLSPPPSLSVSHIVVCIVQMLCVKPLSNYHFLRIWALHLVHELLVGCHAYDDTLQMHTQERIASFDILFFFLSGETLVEAK